MPYEIKKRGEEYCVVKKADGSIVKCHPNHEKALAHLRALYANVSDAKDSATDTGAPLSAPPADPKIADKAGPFVV